MSNHHFHRSAGPFTILLFYYFVSIRFQAEVFARVANPECRTTIFTGRPDRLLFYCFAISFPFGSRQRFLHLGSRNLNVEPPFSAVGRTLPGFFCISDNQSCMSAHVFACRPNVSLTTNGHQHVTGCRGTRQGLCKPFPKACLVLPPLRYP